MSRFKTYIAALFLGVLLCLQPVEAVSGRQLSASSEQLQALYVQRLVKYVRWPKGVAPRDGEPFVIAATNAKRLRPYFKTKGMDSRFRLVQWPAEGAHVLIVIGTPEREAAAILRRTAHLPMLTIGQGRANLRQGVVVNFYRAHGKLKLQVNPKAAERADLFISSRLLKISRIYKGGANE